MHIGSVLISDVRLSSRATARSRVDHLVDYGVSHKMFTYLGIVGRLGRSQ